MTLRQVSGIKVESYFDCCLHRYSGVTSKKPTDGQTGKQIDRQAGRQTGRQVGPDRQTGGKADIQTDG